METKITIIGCGRRVIGEKNGRPYDFVPCFFTYPDKYISGKSCGSFNMPGGKFEQYGVAPGVELDALLFFRNYAIDKVYVL